MSSPSDPTSPGNDETIDASSATLRITPDMVGPAMIGKIVNGLYRVERILGQGGMGCVLQVQQLRLLRKEAMKVPMKQFTEDPEYMKRFRREALTMAQFEHPNIVQVYDVHIAEDFQKDISYITMEFVDGMALDDYIKKNLATLTVGDFLGLLIKIARALDKAHEKQVIHRDIKPANIFIRSSDQEPKLMDFGVARAEIASAYQTQYATTGAQTSSFTAAYAAPEQIMGQPVTGAADLYAFSVTIYRLLCGRYPFDADNATAFILAHVQGIPIPLANRNRNWPEGVNTALMRSMSKDPTQRHPSAQDLVTEIALSLQGLEGYTLAHLYDPEAHIETAPRGIGTVHEVGTHKFSGSGIRTPVVVPPPEEPPKKKRSLVLTTLISLFVLLAGGALAYFVLDGQGAAFRDPGNYFPHTRPAPREGHRGRTRTPPPRLGNPNALAHSHADADPDARSLAHGQTHTHANGNARPHRRAHRNTQAVANRIARPHGHAHAGTDLLAGAHRRDPRHHRDPQPHPHPARDHPPLRRFRRRRRSHHHHPRQRDHHRGPPPDRLSQAHRIRPCPHGRPHQPPPPPRP
jgi:serine/threonine protein kinase